MPRGAFGFDPTVKPFTRSLETARTLLAEAGHPHGFSTTLTASNVDSNVAEALSGLLARAGVRARVNLLDPGTYAARLTSDNRGALGPIYLAASTVWTMDGQSIVQSNVRSDRRQSRWHSKEADRLIDIEELSESPTKRKQAFSDLQRLMRQEAPFVFLYQLDNIFARNDRPRWTPGSAGAPRHGLERGGLLMSALTLDKPPTPADTPSRHRDTARLLRTVLRRLGTALFVLLCTATVSFFLVRLSGDPVKILLPPDATAHQESVLRASLGLDRPLFTQYLDYLWGLPRLDLGDSLGLPASPSAKSSPTGCPPRSNWPPPPWR
ncbi:hypothetical protein SANTM175S_09461 [Streptomyces antimycoticus]